MDNAFSGMEMKDFISQTLQAIMEGAKGTNLKHGNEIEFSIDLVVFEKEGGSENRFSLGVVAASIGVDNKPGSYSSVRSAGSVKFSYRFADTTHLSVA